MDLYAEQIVDLAKNPLNRGEISKPTVTNSGVNTTCGDHIRLYLKLKDGKVVDAKWEGDGCAISFAAVSVLTEEIKGKSVKSLKKLTKENIYKWLEISDLGPARVKCATLSLETLNGALEKLGATKL